MNKASQQKLHSFRQLSQLFFFLILAIFLVFPPHLHAQTEVSIEEAIGFIEPPQGTKYYMENTGNENQLLPFISTLLTIAAVFLGLWVLLNIFLAGYTALNSSGDAAAMSKVRTSITNSAIGLLLIVLAYTLAALAGTIFFGDATLFIEPSF